MFDTPSPATRPTWCQETDSRAHVPASRRLCRGFTIIELMVAVAIVAILAGIAMPSYLDYIRRGQLPEGFAALSDYRVKMEQYYQDNRNYGTTTCADVAGAPSWANFAPTGAVNFTYGCALTNTGQGFVVTASGKTGVAAAGHVYTVDHSNNRATTKFKGSTVAKTCWLSRGSEC